MRYLFLILLAAIQLCAFTAKAETTIRVIEVIGSVKYNKKPVKVGDEFKYTGQIVLSGKDAHLDLIFPSGHRMRFKKNAVVKLEHEHGQNYVHLLAGQVFAYFRHVNPSSVKIKTSTSVAGVRGTKFMVEESKKGTYYCVCDGTVEVTSGKTTRSVVAGEDLWKIPKHPLGQPKSSPDMSKMTAFEFEQMGFQGQ